VSAMVRGLCDLCVSPGGVGSRFGSSNGVRRVLGGAKESVGGTDIYSRKGYASGVGEVVGWKG